jgi:hypothetical protein
MKNYMFLSFVDRDKNINTGACIVEANDLMEAVDIAWQKGINPGGEVAGWQLSKAQYESEPMEVNRLYTPDELFELQYKKVNEK